MKAVLLTGYGDVEKLELTEVADPKAGPGELRVKVASTSVNPVDWKIRGGKYHSFMPVVFPHILGSDASGEVIEVGANVTGFKVGDRVMGLVQHGYAEQVVAKAEAWVLVPPKMDLVDAAALPLVSLTGSQLITEGVGPQKGELVLVTGALGSVGRIAVQTARELGARVVAGVRGTQLAEAKVLGADHIVALDDPSALDQLPTLDAVADTVGGGVGAAALLKVKKGGRFGSVVGEPTGAKDRGVVAKSVLAHPDPKRLAAVAELSLRHWLVPIAKRLPLAKIREAHRLAEAGGVGKVLLTM